MQNDLIIFEFENLDNREVLLLPATLVEIASGLQSLFVEGIQHARDLTEGGIGEPIQAEVFIAAVEPGSVRVGFRAICRLIGSVDRQDVDTAASVVSVVDTVVGWIFKTGIGLYLLHPVIPIDNDQSSVTVEVPPRLAKSQYPDMVEMLVSTALAAGADQVHITAPDQPRCRLSTNNFSANFLGSKGQPLPKTHEGPIQGNLTLLKHPIPFETEKGVVQLGLGRFTFEIEQRGRPQQENRIVLIEWNSSQDYREPNAPPFPVHGHIHSIVDGDYRALSPLSAEHRNVSAILNVTGVQTFN